MLTPRFHFEFKRRHYAIVDLQLMPGTSPMTVPMEVCNCGKPDCRGYNQLQIDPVSALAIMGKAINSLIEELDAAKKQQEPGAN